jgi:hypothetical protein
VEEHLAQIHLILYLGLPLIFSVTLLEEELSQLKRMT